ncbi:MAG: 4Fe-4S dicluster domain-containing protein [Thermodesulfobacteriota bacterium]
MSNPEKQMGRRQFLLAGGLAGAGAVAGATPAFAAEPNSGNKPAIRYGMIIDLKKCVGCKACAAACKAENHTPPGVAYTIVMEQEVGTYPDVRRRFIPRPCMHCSTPSCTIVCPTKATHIRDDGIVAVDYDRCIGCRYCISACPYGVRAFDYGHNYHESPTAYESQPSPEYGRNKKRSLKGNRSPRGNVRKCHFCVHRVTKGLSPACASTCIANAIHFGNLNDPDALCTVHGEKLRFLLATRHHMRLKEDLGNNPSVYYLT